MVLQGSISWKSESPSTASTLSKSESGRRAVLGLMVGELQVEARLLRIRLPMLREERWLRRLFALLQPWHPCIGASAMANPVELQTSFTRRFPSTAAHAAPAPSDPSSPAADSPASDVYRLLRSKLCEQSHLL